MRLISIHKLESHMKLARPVYYHDTLVLKEGCGNLNRFVDNFTNLGITHVYISDDISDGIDIPDVVQESTRHKCKVTLQNTVKKFVQSNTLDVEMLNMSISKLLDEITTNRDILVSLQEIGAVDEYTYIHCISTTIYSLILAQQLGYSESMLKKLAMGTLLHDIGKILLDSKIIFKKGDLSDEEYEYVKTHTSLGYEALKKCPELSELSRIIALSHHEKLDGSGYPNHLTADKIHPFLRIVTICDVYDALTSDRCYRKHWTNKNAYDHFMEYSGTLYDAEYVSIFLKHLAIYPNGSIVQISDGSYAIVKDQNPELPERPIIRVVADSDRKAIAPYEIDLVKNLAITIIDSELDIQIQNKNAVLK